MSVIRFNPPVRKYTDGQYRQAAQMWRAGAPHADIIAVLDGKIKVVSLRRMAANRLWGRYGSARA